MKISILVPDLSSNIVGAATGLADMLSDRHEVGVAGPDFGRGISPMYQGLFDYKIVNTSGLYRFPDYIWESRKLEQAVMGDLIIAVKAFAGTVPVALRARRKRGAKVMVYLDEWDGAILKSESPSQKLRSVIKHIHHPLEYIYCSWVERMIPEADYVVSTSTFLQKRFGGSIVSFGADTDLFSPRPAEESRALRSSLNLEGLKLIVFGGVVRPHKGVEVIIDALVELGRSDVRLVVVGPITEHLQALCDNPKYSELIVKVGSQSKADMPRYLSIADLVVLPLVDTLLARSQVPCKIFEAMAMEKPIIASAVSDLPAILEGCGKVVLPEDPVAMGVAISEVLGDEAKAKLMGKSARERCLQYYSKERSAEKLLSVIQQIA